MAECIAKSTWNRHLDSFCIIYLLKRKKKKDHMRNCVGELEAPCLSYLMKFAHIYLKGC